MTSINSSMSELVADILYDNKHALYTHTGTVVIMQGLPGAGKSKMAKALWDDATPRRAIISANWYFPELSGQGKYALDPRYLSKAHGQCFLTYIDALRSQKELVIVDNNNITTLEIAPYVFAAQAHKYVARIVRIEVPVEIAAQRCTRKIPISKIEEMATQLAAFDPPSNWQIDVVSGE